MSHTEYVSELEQLITKVLLPGYLIYAKEHKQQIPWERIPMHLAKVATTPQPVAKLLTKY